MSYSPGQDVEALDAFRGWVPVVIVKDYGDGVVLVTGRKEYDAAIAERREPQAIGFKVADLRSAVVAEGHRREGISEASGGG